MKITPYSPLIKKWEKYQKGDLIQVKDNFQGLELKKYIKGDIRIIENIDYYDNSLKIDGWWYDKKYFNIIR